MALTCVLNLYEWFHDFFTETRSDLGSRTWGVYQLQPLFYRDCAGREDLHDLSGWSGLPCAGTPFQGPWWELVLWIFPLLLVNSGLNFINNPFRSRWWSLAALMQIVMSLARYASLLVGLDLQTRPEPETGAYSALDVWRRVILVSGIVGPLLAWLGVLALLIRMLELKAAYMEAWHEGAMRYTQTLLSRQGADCPRPGLPGRYQQLAEQLRGTCLARDLPACTWAALEEERRRKGEACAATAEEPHQGVAEAINSAWWSGRRLLARLCQRLGGWPQCGAPGDARKTPGRRPASSTSSKERRAQETQHRLPGLVYVASLLSFVVVVLFSNVLFVGVLELRETCARYTTQARAWAEQAVEAADQVSAAAQQLQQMASFVAEQRAQLQETRQRLLDLHVALELLPARLRSIDSEAAAAVELAATLAKTAAGVLPPNISLAMPVGVPFDSLLVRLAMKSNVAEGVMEAAAGVRRLRDWVDTTSTVVMEVTWSAGVASFVAGLLSLLAVLLLISWTCREWRRIRHGVAVGAVKGSERWQPEVFHPVKAPMLPGLMASSALFAFFWLFVLVFLAIQACWWAKVTLDWQTCKRLCLNTFLLLVFRVFLLDGFIGRRLLSHDGFVVRWCGFSWYICFSLPFHLITSIAMAFSRFVMLVGVAMVYVVRLDTTLLPPGLQAYDPGYVSFMASVLLAHRHQNPVWRGFVHAFLHQKGDCRQPDRHSWAETLCAHHGKGHAHADCSRGRTRAQMRWSLLRTLVNNPQLALERRRFSPCRAPPPAGSLAGGDGLAPEDVRLSLSGGDGRDCSDGEPSEAASVGSELASRSPRAPQGRCLWMWSMVSGL